MKHQKQGLDECQLAVIAMLSDTPLDTIRTLACSMAGVNKWSETTQDPLNTEPFWNTVRDLCVMYGLPQAPMFKVSTMSYIFGETILNEAPEDHKLAQDLMADGLVGKGMLGMMGRYTMVSHVVAFEDGVVYDGNEEGPLELSVWLHKWINRLGWQWFKIARMEVRDND